MRCRRCPPLPEEVRRAADLLERRWTVSILYVSNEGAVRFNEFVQALGNISPATLAQRLADLEEAGVFERAVIDARPPHVEYRLTSRGRSTLTLKLRKNLAPSVGRYKGFARIAGC